jgi:hypothetical protein
VVCRFMDHECSHPWRRGIRNTLGDYPVGATH